MKASSAYSALVTFGVMSLLLATVQTAPAVQDSDDDSSENVLIPRSDSNDISSASWDAIDTAALRKVLMQLDAEDRLGLPSRVSRSWPQSEGRGWSARSLDARMLLRPWRADKRQVRFRQCYFNPISCFRK